MQLRRLSVILACIVIAAVVGIWRPLSDPTGLLELTPALVTTEIAMTEIAALPTLAVLPTLTPWLSRAAQSAVDTCGAAPPARLQPGSEAHVALPREGTRVRRNLFVRDSPGGEAIGLLEPGTNLVVLSDFACTDDGLRWWPIDAGEITGWSVEGFAPDDYMLLPDSV